MEKTVIKLNTKTLLAIHNRIKSFNINSEIKVGQNFSEIVVATFIDNADDDSNYDSSEKFALESLDRVLKKVVSEKDKPKIDKAKPIYEGVTITDDEIDYEQFDYQNLTNETKNSILTKMGRTNIMIYRKPVEDWNDHDVSAWAVIANRFKTLLRFAEGSVINFGGENGTFNFSYNTEEIRLSGKIIFDTETKRYIFSWSDEQKKPENAHDIKCEVLDNFFVIALKDNDNK